jgi:hypothetical protein
MGCAFLIGFGVLFEVSGLALVAWQVWRVQRREFGMPEWWRRLRGVRRVETEVTLGWAVEADTAQPGAVRKRAAPDATVELRVSALEHNVAALDRETRERFERHEKRQGWLQAALKAQRAELQRQQEQREGERRGHLREEITLQWWGTGLFLFGAILAGVANGVC